ncbi:adenosylcobinamide-GDP ribazoletransferase [Polycladidibacter stylochi]|uniref:adenosylcobinamide-GDP ribazoletransferase n=1 Tax=Polycladidibacter stylochi TaxID=1807766 RepID=UPI000835D3D7|nr:adenosylcobinamide-GDP ribazoletransferase [Pseudovibrio stylochi]
MSIEDSHGPETKERLPIHLEAAVLVRFFSRLPLPQLCSRDDLLRAPDFRQMTRALPFATAIIAFPAFLSIAVLGASALPAFLCGIIGCAVGAAVTGSLHEDGFSDVCDGFFGGATKERRLEIMKDSRIGAFGACGLCLALLFRVGAIAALVNTLSPFWAAYVYLCAEIASRFAMAVLWAVMPAAYEGGLGSRFGKPSGAALYWALAGTVLFLLPLLFAGLGINIVFALTFSIAATFFLKQLAHIKVGGITGDVLGACQQLSLMCFFFGWLLIGG